MEVPAAGQSEPKASGVVVGATDKTQPYSARRRTGPGKQTRTREAGERLAWCGGGKHTVGEQKSSPATEVSEGSARESEL